MNRVLVEGNVFAEGMFENVKVDREMMIKIRKVKVTFLFR